MTMGSLDEGRIVEVCELLVRSFRDLSPTWVPTVDAARAKVVEALEPGMLSRVLLIDDRVVGWVGARHDYGSVWELHPLVVDEAMRGRGDGRALVDDVECLAAGRGALTMLLGTTRENAAHPPPRLRRSPTNHLPIPQRVLNVREGADILGGVTPEDSQICSEASSNSPEAGALPGHLQLESKAILALELSRFAVARRPDEESSPK